MGGAREPHASTLKQIRELRLAVDDMVYPYCVTYGIECLSFKEGLSKGSEMLSFISFPFPQLSDLPLRC